MRTYPKNAEQFLDEAQQHVIDTGRRIEVLDGSKELLIIFGDSEKEWAFRLTQIKSGIFNDLLVDHFVGEKRRALAGMISDLKCLRPYGATICRCGTDICPVAEILLT